MTFSILPLTGLALFDLLKEEARLDGLFAAGRTAVGICSNSYVSGLSLADCIFSGRRAGSHAAAAPSGARDGA